MPSLNQLAMVMPYISLMQNVATNPDPTALMGNLVSLALARQQQRPSPGGLGGGTTGGGTASTVYPGGDTSYKYRTYDFPYSGDPGNLVSRQGVTLQRGPMKSLVQIARESNLMPGIQEIGEIGGGYRLHQPTGNPYAAPEGYSYHQQGLAIDAGWWSEHPALARALSAAGWNQFGPSYEPWHWSYGVTG